MTQDLLQVENLSVNYGSDAKPLLAVAHASFSLKANEIVGVAGESGSGKSTLCTALIRSLPANALVGGRIQFGDQSLLDLSPAQMRKVRGHEITMILQNPMTALDPLFTIGHQMVEVLQKQKPHAPGKLMDRAIELLKRVHLTAPELRVTQYPHQLSGGMKQRVLIAMATACSPRLLIADEPTTALDATIQEEVLLLFRELRDTLGTAFLLVTHDLAAIRRICDRTIIMYAGRIVEEGPTTQVFSSPKHPYTQALLASLPHIEDDEVVMSSIPGQVPSLAELGTGCAFADRCTQVMNACRTRQPVETWTDPAHRVFCQRYEALP
jgi:peptide/nickel transport system ATP-binding protein